MLTLLARLFLLLFAAVVAFLLVAYKGPEDPQQVNFRPAPTQYHTQPADYELDFVELDDDGNLAEPVQAYSMLDDLGHHLTQSDTVMVLYIHDWMHNARQDDGDVACFASLLQAMAAAQRRYGHFVHGVYLGWPGVVYDDPILQRLSFVGREWAVDRLGGAGQVRWLLQQIQALKSSAQRHRLKFAIVAHSLGARLLYRTLQEAARQGVTDLADVVVVVNPAIATAEAYQPWMVSGDRSAPRFVIATSERDEVLNHDFFWTKTAGAMLWGEFDRQQWNSLRAVGLGDALVTHDLRLQGSYTPQPGPCQALDAIALQDGWHRQSMEVASNYWHINKADARGQLLYTTTLVARQRVMDPSVMVVKVDGAIIPDHGTVFTTPFVDFVSRLLNYALDRVGR